MSNLLSVEAALERILVDFQSLPAVDFPLSQSRDRILAEDVISAVNVPPFANSSMDGYALRAEDTLNATAEQPVRLLISMDIPAGASPQRPLDPGQAARIMTGAPVPDGADAVVPVELTDSTWAVGSNAPLPESVGIRTVAKVGDNIRPIGEDIRAGQVVIVAGTCIRPEEIGVLASIGRAQVPVIRQPVVAIVSTGDELVEVGAQPQPGQIRDSNSHALAALVESYGGVPIRLPIARDTLSEVRACFQTALAHEPDVIISSAGVSVGAFDVVRTVIDELGRVDFWRINVRPGKPLAYGRVGQVPYFGLPGNPVSAMVTFDLFVRPAICKLGNRSMSVPTVQAIVAEDMRSDGRRSYLRVRLSLEAGRYYARLTGTQSSGALTSMIQADGLLIVPEAMKLVPAGTELAVRLLRSISETA